jgi:hypothetical protein
VLFLLVVNLYLVGFELYKCKIMDQTFSEFYEQRLWQVQGGRNAGLE